MVMNANIVYICHEILLASYPGCCGGGKMSFHPHNSLGMRLEILHVYIVVTLP